MASDILKSGSQVRYSPVNASWASLKKETVTIDIDSGRCFSGGVAKSVGFPCATGLLLHC